jgi:hypothetical protein
MKKKLVLSLFSLASLVSVAQDYSKQYFYTSGGNYTDPKNKVKVAVLINGKDQAIDSVKGNFSNAVSIYHDQENARYEGIAHIGRSSNTDLLVRYDLDTYKRRDSVTSSGVQSFARNATSLVVAKGYGATGAYVDILDAKTLDLIKAMDEISNPTTDVEIWNNMAFVSHSLKGKRDGCAPYGCYQDSIGYVSLIDLAKDTLIQTISLGTKAAGLKNLILKSESDGHLHVYFSNFGDSVKVTSRNIVFQSIKSCYTAAVTQDLVFGIEATAPILTAVKIDKATEAVQKQSLIKQAGTYDNDVYQYDTTTSTYLILRTDYATFGSVIFYNMDEAKVTDSVFVGVSATALAIDYRTPLVTSLEMSNSFESVAKIYPNPCKEMLTVQNISNADSWEIRNVQGQSIQNGQIIAHEDKINTEGLAKGMYTLILKGDSEARAIKFIKD